MNLVNPLTGETLNADCGTGDGGFKPGNTCAKGSETSRDTAQVNIPLSKRGNIDAQIDKYKAEKQAEAKRERKTAAGQKKEDKAVAKELFAKYGASLVEKTAAKSGKPPKEVKAFVTDMIKWSPDKARALLERFEKEQG